MSSPPIHSFLKQHLANKHPFLIDLFNAWLENGKEELGKKEIKKLFSKKFENLDFPSHWKILKDNDLLNKSSINGLYSLSVLAMNISEYAPNKTSRYKADEIIRQLLLKTKAYNAFAYSSSLPSVASLVVWGSYLSTNKHIGDIDVSIMFRQNKTKIPHPLLPFQKIILNSLKLSNTKTLSYHEIEDNVSSWLSPHPISLTGLDNLRSIQEIKPSPIKVIYQDEWLVNENDYGPGVKSYEADDFFALTSPTPKKKPTI